MARSTRRQESPQEADSSRNSLDIPPPAAASTSREPGVEEGTEVEEPVREQLKKTSIAGTGQDVGDQNEPMTDKPEDETATMAESDTSSKEGSRGRIRKKRSFEDFDEDQQGDYTMQKGERHIRKKSRDHGTELSSGSNSRNVSGDYAIHKIDEANDDTLPKDTNDSKVNSANTKNVQGLRLAKPSTPPPSEEIMKDEDMVTSPKNKRNRDEFLQDEGDVKTAVGKSHEMDIKDSQSADNDQDATSDTNDDEPNRKRQRDSPKPLSPPADDPLKDSPDTVKSGFGNSSTTSPFASLSGRKSPTASSQTSSNAFAASGFGSLAASGTSGFGSLGAGASTKSNFGSALDKKSSGLASSGSTSGFGGLASGNKSSFASPGVSSNDTPASGFGGLQKSSGSGFGGNFAPASSSRLSSFASGDGGKITGLSDRAAKPFGAATKNEESEEGSEEDEEESGERLKSPPLEEERKDKRFFEQELETGEENESTIFSCRAKLYYFDTDKREWKERGVGVVKVNVQGSMLEESGEKAPPKARFVMRADGSHRVVLNSPIKKGLTIEDPRKPGEKPTGNVLAFLGSIDGKLESLQMKLRPTFAEQLWQKVTDLQAEM